MKTNRFLVQVAVSLQRLQRERTIFRARFIVAVVMFVALAFQPSALGYGTFTWTGGGANNNWNTAGNWGGTAPADPQNDLHFAGSSRTLNTNNLGSFAAGHRITFDSGASSFTIRGNEIKFFDFGGARAQINNNSVNTMTIDMRIGSGNAGGGLDINANAGDIVYNGTINGTGMIFFDDGGAAASQMRFDGNGGKTVTLNHRIINGNTTASVAIRSNTIVIYASSNYTYSGGTFLDAGQLWISTNATISNSISLGPTVARSDNAGVFAYATAGGKTVTNAITIRSGGTGTLTLGGFNTSGENTFSGTVTLQKGVMLSSPAGGTNTFSGQVTAASTQTATAGGAGIVRLAGTADNANLALAVSNGVAVLAKTSGSSVHAVGSGLTLTAGTVQLGGSGGDQLWDGSAPTANPIAINGGTFDLNGNSESINGLSGSGGTILNNVSSTTSTLTIGVSGGGGIYSGTIADGNGTVALVKSGSGTNTFNGANTYSGGTTVNGGTLLVNNSTGSGTGSGTVVVNSGATLGGGGRIAGAVTVSSGATLSPGASIGVITFDVAPTLSGTNYVELDRLASTNADKLIVSSGGGTLVFGGTLTVVNIAGTLQPNDTFDLFDADAFSGAFTATNLPTLSAGLAWDFSQLLVNGTIKVVCDGTLVANAGSDQEICPGNSVGIGGSPTASGGSGSGYTYSWSPTNGLSSAAAANPTASPSSTTTYTVTVTDSSGCTANDSVIVTVNTSGAFITTQPTNQTACQATTGTFSVAATGTGLTYQWRKNGVNLTDGPTGNGSTYGGVNAASLGITNVQPADAAFTTNGFDCVVTGSACSPATSTRVSLTVVGSPSITTQPTNTSACASSGTASFSIGANATDSYQWYQGAPPGTQIGGATSNALHLTGLTIGDNGSQYFCVLTGCGGTTATSDVVTLTVNEAVSISGNPSSSTNCVGDSVTFTVSASGTGLTYQWRKNGANVSGATTNSYTISPVASGDAANSPGYDCVVSGTSPCGSLTSSVATLTVRIPPGISVQLQSQTVCSGSSVTFSVTATNAAAYQWRKDGANISGATVSSYVISPATTGDAANSPGYDCVVSGNSPCASITSSVATLTINVAPSITTQPSAQTVCSGSSATFSVVATGTSPTYVWRKRGSGWGSGNQWQFTAGGGGFFFFNSTNNDGGTLSTNINSGNNRAWGMFNPSGVVTEAVRQFTPMAIGQTFSLDMDNGSVNGTVGFGLRNSSGQNRFEFYFVGGNSFYTVGDNSGPITTTIGFTRSGVNVQLTLTGTDSYSVTVSRKDGAATQTITGTLANSGSIDRVRLFNANGQGGSSYDLFFNNLSMGPFEDNAGNYTSSLWTTGGANVGNGPLANGGNISGATTASLTINPATSSDATNYDVAIYNSCGQATSTAQPLTVNPLPPAFTVTGGGAYCAGGSGAAVGLSGSQSGVSYQLLLEGSPTGSLVSGTGAAISFGDQTNAGNYSVTASNDTTGCTAIMTGSTTVSINARPTAVVSGDAMICSGTPTMISAALTGAGPWNVTWSDGFVQSGVSSSPATRNVSPVSTTNYTVTSLSDTNCAAQPGDLTGSATITVDSASFGGTATPASSTVCSGNGTTISLSGQNGSVVKWQYSSDNFSSDVHDIISTDNPLNTGNLTATTSFRAVVQNGVCPPTNSSVATVTVDSLSVGGTATPLASTVCYGNSTTISLSGQTGSIVKWQYSSDNFSSDVHDIASTDNPLNTGNLTATTSFRAVVQNGVCSMTNSSVATVTVNTAATANAGPDQTICANSSATLAGSIGGSATNGTWSGGAGTFSPDNTTLNATYTPTTGEITAGTLTLTLTTDDPDGPCGAANDSVTITINPQPTLSPAALDDGVFGVAYSNAVAATGGDEPYTYTVTSNTLPSGLSLNSTNGTITGTPDALGTNIFTITVTDESGCSGSQTYEVIIGCPPITVVPATLPDGTVGGVYNQPITASGGAAPHTFAMSSGVLPAGLSLGSGGVLSGTPTNFGIYPFTIEATDTNGCTGSQGYSVTIYAGAPDGIGPVVTILSPTTKTVVSTNQIVVYGRASDPAGILQVMTRANGGAYSAATLVGAVNVRYWTNLVTLNPGTNAVNAKGIDGGGVEAVSKTNLIFLNVPTTVIITNIGDGSGTIGGAAVEGANQLAIGRDYRLSVVPTGNSLLSNILEVVNGVTNIAWTPLVPSKDGFKGNKKFMFTGKPNQQILVNFVTNRFQNAAGVYYGLFSEGTTAHESSGWFTVKTDSKLKFSGRLMQEGEIVSFSGTFDLAGIGTPKPGKNIVRKLPFADILTLGLQLDLGGSNKVFGSVVSTNWGGPADMDGDKLVLPYTNTAAAAKFALVMVGSTNATALPAGDGYVIDKPSVDLGKGTLKAQGYTGEGVAVKLKTVNTGISADGTWPFYAQLYQDPGNKKHYHGAMIGWLSLSNGNVTGDLIWTKKYTAPSGTPYSGGFTSMFSSDDGTLLSSPRSDGSVPLPVPPLQSSGTLTIQDGGFVPSPNVTSFAYNSGDGKVAVPGSKTNGITVIIKSTAEAKGNVDKIGPNKWVGVSLQNVQTVRGAFTTGGATSGSVRLTP